MKSILFWLEWYLFPNWKTIYSREIKQPIKLGYNRDWVFTYFYIKYSKIRDEYKITSYGELRNQYPTVIAELEKIIKLRRSEFDDSDQIEKV